MNHSPKTKAILVYTLSIRPVEKRPYDAFIYLTYTPPSTGTNIILISDRIRKNIIFSWIINN